MYRKDYIQKVIDQLGQMLGKILSYLPESKDYNDFQNQKQDSEARLKEALGITFEELLHLPASHWITKLNDDFTLTHLAHVADIHFTIAQLYFENGRGEKHTNTLRESFLLYKHLEENDTIYVYERYLKMEWIKSQSGS